MRHLKTFESKSNTFEETSHEEYYSSLYGDGYSESDVDEEVAFVNKNWIDFTEKDVDKIKELYKVAKIVVTSYDADDDDCIPKNTIVIDLRGKLIEIIKFTDEWFYVELWHSNPSTIPGPPSPQRRYYKCDQWEGLMDCLRSLKYIKVRVK